MSTMDTIRSGFVEAARVLEQFTNDRTAWEALEQAGPADGGDAARRRKDHHVR
ncbi:hypothetical protein [Alistipes indistinctus]|uniref:hypothetical protein n=1 Tax=Alistipes indistinctus TaxID=626932 RepID=UPI0035213D50